MTRVAFCCRWARLDDGDSMAWKGRDARSTRAWTAVGSVLSPICRGLLLLLLLLLHATVVCGVACGFKLVVPHDDTGGALT